VAQNTIFGWILFGPCDEGSRTHYDNLNGETSTASFHMTIAPSLDDDLRRFWELEKLSPVSPLSEDDNLCEAIFYYSLSFL